MLLLPVLLLLGLCHTAAASLMHKTEKLAVLTDTAKLSPEDFHSALGGVKPDPGTSRWPIAPPLVPQRRC